MNYTNKRKRRSNASSSNNNAPGRGRRRGSRNNRRAVKGIDVNQLIQKAKTQKEEEFVPATTFAEMPLNRQLKRNLEKKGFVSPTKIQQETIAPLVEGRDLLGIAKTGTGKTGAFLIPVIHQLMVSRSFTTLVVVPTRELAQQVEDEFKSLTTGMGLYSACFIGGTNVGRDIASLKKGKDVIIGTPGRLMDLADRGVLRFDQISTLVLDEFDRMLDMGFIDDVKKIVRLMTLRDQTMLFSATIDDKQQAFIDQLLNNPIVMKVSSGTATADHIEQDIIRVPSGGDKFEMLCNLLVDAEFEKVLVFAETKRMVDKISKKLKQSGVTSDLIHGDKSQNYRSAALNKFKKGNVKVLVATDVAARGIDVSNITHVINYQVPLTYDSYIHRIGRTGRAGKVGKAFTFVD